MYQVRFMVHYHIDLQDIYCPVRTPQEGELTAGRLLCE